MMEMAKVTSKGQITIPISIRRRLSINEGDKLLFINKPDGVMMVNPDMLGGDPADYAAEAAETAAPDPAVAAVKKKVAKPTPVAEVEEKSATDIEPEEDVAVEAAAAEVTAPAERAPRPVPPPVEEPEQPDKQIGGLNLSSLLDDIRSIGSNI